MKYTRPTDGLDKDARLYVEGVAQAEQTSVNDNDNEQGWIALCGFTEPKEPPAGYVVEVKRDSFLGIAYAYRFMPASLSEAA